MPFSLITRHPRATGVTIALLISAPVLYLMYIETRWPAPLSNTTVDDSRAVASSDNKPEPLHLTKDDISSLDAEKLAWFQQRKTYPDTQSLRSALNAYAAGETSSALIDSYALTGDPVLEKAIGHTCGLDREERHFYRQELIALDTEDNIMGGEWIRLLSTTEPISLFIVWMYGDDKAGWQLRNWCREYVSTSTTAALPVLFADLLAAPGVRF